MKTARTRGSIRSIFLHEVVHIAQAACLHTYVRAVTPAPLKLKPPPTHRTTGPQLSLSDTERHFWCTGLLLRDRSSDVFQ